MSENNHVQNDIRIHLTEPGTPSIVINGVEVSGAIPCDWTLRSEHEPGVGSTAYLTVTYPVSPNTYLSEPA